MILQALSASLVFDTPERWTCVDYGGMSVLLGEPHRRQLLPSSPRIHGTVVRKMDLRLGSLSIGVSSPFHLLWTGFLLSTRVGAIRKEFRALDFML